MCQFLAFAAVGAVGTLAHYAVLGVGTACLGWPAAWASGAGCVTGAVVNYLLNARYTFAGGRPRLETAGRFYIVVGAGWFINIGLMGLLADRLGWNVWLAQALTTGIGLVWNFAGSKLWAFRDKGEARTPPMTIANRLCADREWR